MCNECNSVCVPLEAILLLLYAWNSCPVTGTDISCSFVAAGHEFAFPIDFSSGKHWESTSSPSTVILYSKKLATHLAACCLVAKLLVCKQHSYHWELINAHCPDPRLYSIGELGRLSDLIPHTVKLTNYSTHSLGCGAFQQSSRVYYMRSCTVTMRLETRKCMHWTYHLTQPNLFHFSQLTEPTLGTDNYKNQLLHIHSRRQVLRDSPRFSRSRFLQILLKQINVPHSIGPVSLSSMIAPFP
jgi:hypothetical protein